MKTLTRSVGKMDIGGEPLPTVFTSFSNNKIIFRRSDLTMIAGTPGSGKSTLALAKVLRAGLPTLYISADTSAHTMAMRLYSMITGKPQGEAEHDLSYLPDASKKVLARASHIYWSFEAAPTLSDIDEEVKAFYELWGEYPAVIVVDNLMDITAEAEDYSSLKHIMKELKFLARDKNAAVLVLHHTKESYRGNPTQPMAAVQGMVNQLPAMILTVAQAGTNMMAVSPVKNRYGQSSPDGEFCVYLQFVGEYMYIDDVMDAR